MQFELFSMASEFLFSRHKPFKIFFPLQITEDYTLDNKYLMHDFFAHCERPLKYLHCLHVIYCKLTIIQAILKSHVHYSGILMYRVQ